MRSAITREARHFLAIVREPIETPDRSQVRMQRGLVIVMRPNQPVVDIQLKRCAKRIHFPQLYGDQARYSDRPDAGRIRHERELPTLAQAEPESTSSREY